MWTTPSRVAAHVGCDSADPRLPELVAAASAYCQRLRVDLTEETLGDDQKLAATLYAAHLFRVRTNPAGSAVFDELGADAGEQDSLLSEVWRLLGARKPKIR